MPLGLKLVRRYVLSAIFPYFCLSLALLSISLIAQQTARFAEIIGSASAPLDLVSEILLYLFPSILVFTIPTAALIGTLVGLGRMSSDSELVAMRAAGVGTGGLLVPSLLFGLLLSFVALFVNFYVAPNAARELRKIAVQAALRRLESPVEPRTFYTEMAGKVVFVREGDTLSGEWGRVFIHWQDEGAVRLVTARSGRIDTTGEQVELVLSDAEVISLPGVQAAGGVANSQITTEQSAALRMKDDRLDAGRKSLLKSLSGFQLQPEEMGWHELRRRLREGQDKEKINATLIFHRRLALCLAPFTFALFGCVIGLRNRRGGKGLGFALSTVTLITYYLIAVGAENIARAKIIPPAYGAWTANFLLILFALLLLKFNSGGFPRGLSLPGHRRTPQTPRASSSFLLDRLNWGLLDAYILRTLTVTFAAGMFVLTAVFLIFTLFDLLRFLYNEHTNLSLISRYMLFMLPYAAAILAPMAVLVAVLATFAVMARRNEAIAWWASGQSVYRLAVPGFVFASVVCLGMWQLQESVLPYSNPRQNALRTQIRGGNTQTSTPLGRQWLANSDLTRIYSYAYDRERDELIEPVVFEFDEQGIYLRRVISAGNGGWDDGRQLLKLREARLIQRVADHLTVKTGETETIEEEREIFKPTLKNPGEMDFKQLSDYLKATQGNDTQTAMLSVSLARKLSEPFSPLVLALIGIPMAFAFGRRNAIVSLCVAVGLGLTFWASNSGFYYLGIKGMVPPHIAAWSPAAIFGAVGAYMLFRSHT
jgi:LPS export ABC transporter permease LptG/LPS export ABC transporter permease LptF